MNLHPQIRPSRQSRICSEVRHQGSIQRLLADRIFGAARARKLDRSFRCSRLRFSVGGIPLLLKALYFKGIE